MYSYDGIACGILMLPLENEKIFKKEILLEILPKEPVLMGLRSQRKGNKRELN